MNAFGTIHESAKAATLINKQDRYFVVQPSQLRTPKGIWLGRGDT